MPGSRDLSSAERLSADDMATRTEAEFLAAALRHQQLQASMPGPAPGMCANCGSVCLPRAVYCDEGCRSDHERRLAVRSRTGGR